MYRFPEDEAVYRTGKMYRILDSAGIRIIRVGLKSSDIITDKDAACGGTFHPAFRQLVEGRPCKAGSGSTACRPFLKRKSPHKSRLLLKQ